MQSTVELNKILAVAINDYDDFELNKIQNCSNDVTNILDLLTNKYCFESPDFYKSKESTTRKKLFSIIKECFLNALENENILFLYAGHGNYDPELKVFYIQPSDADSTDISSWINFNEIIGWVKVSKAKHISLIFDSCFSGSILELHNYRGGGFKAFEVLKNKKSRYVLTSGGTEKVWDGEKGDNSPFAKTLIDILKNNDKEEYSFEELANDTILKFSPDITQTPEKGSLNIAGHDGGVFYLKTKTNNKIKEIKEIKDKNKYLKSKLSTIFIELDIKTIKLISQYLKLNERKRELVLDQKYEEATVIREEEKIILINIKKHITNNKKIFPLVSEFNQNEIKESKIFDKLVELYYNKLDETKRLFNAQKKKT